MKTQSELLEECEALGCCMVCGCGALVICGMGEEPDLCEERKKLLSRSKVMVVV